MLEKMQYAKNGFFSYSGKVIMIVTGFVYTIMIANYLEPGRYGLVNYYISFTLGLIGISGIAFLCAMFSVFMPRWKSMRFSKYIFYGVFVISLLLFFVVFIFPKNIADLIGKGNYDLLQATSFLLLVMPFNLYYTLLFRSYKMFGKELKFNTIVAIFNLCIAFLLVIVLNYGVLGVVYGMVISNLIGLAFFVLMARKLHYANSPVVFRDLMEYTKYGVVATLLRRIDIQAFLILMGLFVADSELGLFYMATKISSTILSTPVTSLTEVIVPYMSESSMNKKKLSRYVSMNIKFSLIATTVLSVLLIALSPIILGVFFPKYVTAYPYIMVIVIFYVVSAFSPLDSLLLSINRTDLNARARFFGLLSTIFLGFFLMRDFGVYGVIMTQTANAIIVSSVFVYSVRSIGIDVDFVPGKDDIIYFLGYFRKVIGGVKYRILKMFHCV